MPSHTNRTVLTTPDPALVELASEPWDFVWIDMEHGAIDRHRMQGMLVGAAAADAADIPWGVAASMIDVAVSLLGHSGSIAVIATDLRLYRAAVDEAATTGRARLAGRLR